MKWPNGPGDIPQSAVDACKKKKTYQRLVRLKYGDTAEHADSQWRQVIWDKSKSRHEYYVRKQVPAALNMKSGGDDGNVNVQAQLAGTMQDYLEYYTEPTPNDSLSLQQLVSMHRQLEIVDLRIQELLRQTTVDVSAWRSLTTIQKNLSAETRLIQESLGISRKQRDAKHQDRQLSDHLQDIISQAKALVKNRGVQFVCPYCTTTNINQGFAVHHFPEMGLTIRTRCPSCLQEYEIVVPPHDWRVEAIPK